MLTVRNTPTSNGALLGKSSILISKDDGQLEPYNPSITSHNECLFQLLNQENNQFFPAGKYQIKKRTVLLSHSLIKTTPPKNTDKRMLRVHILDGNIIGKGSFGEVETASYELVLQSRTANLNIVDHVVKKIALQYELGTKASKEEIDSIYNEANSLNDLLDVYSITVLKKQNAAYITMDRAKGLDLNKALETKEFSLLSFEDRLSLVIDLCVQINIMQSHRTHRNGKAHRDLKPENIKYNPDTKRLLVLDWGLASDSEETVSSLAGTWGYIEPNVKELKNNVSLSDVYALSAIVAQIFGCSYNSVFQEKLQLQNNGINPWIANQAAMRFDDISHMPMPYWSDDELSKDIKQEIQKFLVTMADNTPSKRPSVQEILTFFTQVYCAPDKQKTAIIRYDKQKTYLASMLNQASDIDLHIEMSLLQTQFNHSAKKEKTIVQGKSSRVAVNSKNYKSLPNITELENFLTIARDKQEKYAALLTDLENVKKMQALLEQEETDCFLRLAQQHKLGFEQTVGYAKVVTLLAKPHDMELHNKLLTKKKFLYPRQGTLIMSSTDNDLLITFLTEANVKQKKYATLINKINELKDHQSPDDQNTTDIFLAAARKNKITMKDAEKYMEKTREDILKKRFNIAIKTFYHYISQSEKFKNTNSDGLHNMRNFCDDSATLDNEKWLLIVKEAQKKMSPGLSLWYSRSSLFGKGRHRNVDILYQQISATSEVGNLADLLTHVNNINTFIRDNAFLHSTPLASARSEELQQHSEQLITKKTN